MSSMSDRPSLIRAEASAWDRSKKLAFSGRHVFRAEPGRAGDVAGVVAMEVAVEEDLHAFVRPFAEPRANADPWTIGASPQWLGTTSKAILEPTCVASISTSPSTSLSKRGETSWIDASRRRSV